MPAKSETNISLESSIPFLLILFPNHYCSGLANTKQLWVKAFINISHLKMSKIIVRESELGQCGGSFLSWRRVVGTREQACVSHKSVRTH